MSAQSQIGVRKGSLDPHNRERFLKGLPFEFNGSSDDFVEISQSGARTLFGANAQVDSAVPSAWNITSKTLGNTCASGATDNVSDIVFWGNGDTFQLISKASSESEGWMKSTKAMQAGTSVVVQVTTQQRNPDGSYSLAEALTTVPHAKIVTKFSGSGDDMVPISRSIVLN